MSGVAHSLLHHIGPRGEEAAVEGLDEDLSRTGKLDRADVADRAAVAISIPLTIRTFTGLGPTDFPWPMFWITFAFAALAAWIFTARVSQSLWFFVALGWGLVGIVLNNWLHTEMNWIAWIAGAGTATILLLRVTRRANGPRSGS